MDRHIHRDKVTIAQQQFFDIRGRYQRQNLQGESKKTGISGVLADFGNLFFQNVMAANIITNFKNFEIF